MYLLFRYKSILPSQYYWLPAGEKRIVRAFLERELEEKLREKEELEKAFEGR